MVANQTLVASDGKEVMLFPLEYINISQGENGEYSHQGTLNIDFLGWGPNGRVMHAPIYAPCSCRCVAIITGADNGRVFQSLNLVHTPRGLEIVTFMFFHDNTPIASVGDIFNQGQLIGHTGTAGNVTGDHMHFNTANGLYVGGENVPPANQWQLKNSEHIYDICYDNNTVIVNGYGYNWQEYQGGVTPGYMTKTKFKWVLYANKLRDRNIKQTKSQ